MGSSGFHLSKSVRMKVTKFNLVIVLRCSSEHCRECVTPPNADFEGIAWRKRLLKLTSYA